MNSIKLLIFLLIFLLLIIDCNSIVEKRKRKRKWKGCKAKNRKNCRKKSKKTGLTPVNIVFIENTSEDKINGALEILKSGPCKGQSIKKFTILNNIVTAYVKDSECKMWLDKFDDDDENNELSPVPLSPIEKEAADIIKTVEIDAIVNAVGSHTTTYWQLEMLSSNNNGETGHGIYDYPFPGGKGVTAFVLDTGVNESPEFTWPDSGKSRIKNKFTTRFCDSRQYNCDNFDGSVDDLHGHGTHVAGSLAATSFGIAPHAEIVSVKVLGSHGGGSISSVIGGMDLSAKLCHNPEFTPTHKCVINLSLNTDFVSEVQNDATKRIRDSGIILVSAAGNDNTDACNQSPASSISTITVGAITPLKEKASFSNYGSCVDVWSPGVDIRSVNLNGESSVVYSGTSMAAPHVAGIVALSLSQSKVTYVSEGETPEISPWTNKGILPSKEYLAELTYIELCIKEAGINHVICDDGVSSCPNTKIPLNNVYGKLDRPTLPTNNNNRRRRRKKRRKRRRRKRR